MTAVFLLYLAHRSLVEQRWMLDRWRAAKLDTASRDEQRGMIQVLEELCFLELSAIQKMYGKQPDQPAQEK